MTVTDAIHHYFTAERDLGLLLSGLGLGALLFGGVMARAHAGPFLWGMLIPLGIVGLGALLGGAGLALRSQGQDRELAPLAERDPSALLAAELPRMARVNANWPRAKAAWGVGIVLCLATLLLVRREGPTGAAQVLLVTFSLLMMVDTLGERRGRVYEGALLDLQRATTASAGAPALSGTQR